jgi:hypothetical protein
MKNRNILIVTTALCLVMALLWLLGGPTLVAYSGSACCLPDGSCVMAYDESECFAQGGISFHFEKTCSEVSCAPVGGHTEPVSTLTLAWPWLALAAAVTTGTATLITLKRRSA